jgi:uncharacterized protein (TIGR00255 family)
MNSMTGYAQGRLDSDDFSLQISFKSLNHRFLDINFKGSGITPGFEKYIRQLFKDTLYRGRVDVICDLFETNPERWNIQFNDALLKEILDRVSGFKKTYPQDVTLSLDPLLRLPMIFHLDFIFGEGNEKQQRMVKRKAEQVFKEFLRNRASEGKAIQEDVLVSTGRITQLVKVLERDASDFEKEMFERYKTKINRLIETRDVDEKRVLQEAAILAEKVCVTEEINRLRTHGRRVVQLTRDRSTTTKGKELDFLCQEMLRETHTIAAKVNSTGLHDQILLVRREIEKIRQQVQNVE